MPLLAVVRIESDPAAATQTIAALAKCTAYDARMRLAAGLPAVVARVDAGAAAAAVETLAEAKVSAVVVDDPVPSRSSRLCAQTIGLGAGVMKVTSRAGESRLVKDEEIWLVLRGVRSSSTICAPSRARTTRPRKSRTRGRPSRPR